MVNEFSYPYAVLNDRLEGSAIVAFVFHIHINGNFSTLYDPSTDFIELKKKRKERDSFNFLSKLYRNKNIASCVEKFHHKYSLKIVAITNISANSVIIRNLSVKVKRMILLGVCNVSKV